MIKNDVDAISGKNVTPLQRKPPIEASEEVLRLRSMRMISEKWLKRVQRGGAGESGLSGRPMRGTSRSQRRNETNQSARISAEDQQASLDQIVGAESERRQSSRIARMKLEEKLDKLEAGSTPSTQPFTGIPTPESQHFHDQKVNWNISSWDNDTRNPHSTLLFFNIGALPRGYGFDAPKTSKCNFETWLTLVSHEFLAG